MKKILTAIAVAVFIIYPSICFTSYLIHLKDGREFVTDRYWEEGGQIKFKRYGGVIGIERSLVKGIEKTEDLPGKKEIVEPERPVSKAKDAEKGGVPEKVPAGKEAETESEGPKLDKGNGEKGKRTGEGGEEGSVKEDKKAVAIEVQPESGEDLLSTQDNLENKEIIEKFKEEFRLFEKRFKDVRIMNDEELYNFAKDLSLFKRDVLTSRLGHIFSKQLLKTYSMGDEIEAILKSRGH